MAHSGSSTVELSVAGRPSFVVTITLAAAIVFIILLLYILDLSQPESAKQLV